jgi:hypothetical protein
VTFAHSGARDKRGTVVLHPHIGNLTRSVRFHSLNRTGNDRAHSMFHHMADVDVRYASFLDMGRTTSLDLHCTLRANGSAVDDVDCIMGSGRVTQTGRNQKGRYAVHFHKLMGPRNDTNTGYQGRFIGNVIRDSTKWPLTIHDSSYLLIQDNVIWRGQGACVMFEEGNEHFNVLDGNLIVGCNGRTLADNDVDVMAGCSSNCADPREHGGREGSGIWARGFNNYFRNNVSAGHWNDWQQIVSSAGYKFENGMTLTNAGMVNSTGAGVKVRVPKFRGADLLDRGESTEEFMRQLPLLEFANNEAYGGIATCLTVWYHQDPDSPSGNRTASLKDFKCWGFYEDAFFMYPLSRYALTGWRVYGPYNSLNRAYSHGVYNGDYSVADVSISDTIIHNVATCMSGFAISGSYSVSNVDLACDFGFERKMFQSGSNGSRPVGPQRFTFTNVTWEGIGGTPVRIQGHTSTNDVFLYMHWCATTEAGDPCADGGAFDQPNLPHTTTVRNLNGNGLQYDVYFIEQGNRDIAGGRAPCLDSKSHREVRGIVCGAQAWSPGQSAAVVPQGESQKR